MKKRHIPKFDSPEKAALFWENNNVLDFVDANEFKVIKPGKSRKYHFINPRKKAPKQLISLRVDSALLDKAKKLAGRRHVGYQSILRQWLEKSAH